MRIVSAAFVLILLAGCASTQPLSKETVQVGPETVTYVYGSYHDTMGVDMTICDRYDSQGHLITHDAASAAGTIHSVLQTIPSSAAATTAAGAVMGAVLPANKTTVQVSK